MSSFEPMVHSNVHIQLTAYSVLLSSNVIFFPSVGWGGLVHNDIFNQNDPLLKIKNLLFIFSLQLSVIEDEIAGDERRPIVCMLTRLR